MTALYKTLLKEWKDELWTGRDYLKKHIKNCSIHRELKTQQ